MPSAGAHFGNQLRVATNHCKNIMSNVGLVSLAESPAEKTTELKRIVASSFIGTARRVVRFLDLRHGNRAGLQQAVLSNARSGAGYHIGVRHLRRRIPSPPIGRRRLRTLGDRVGRKTMLVWSLMIMGVATTLIGFLPTYATIGVWAPILLVLVRFAQGIGVGGEWGGAVLMAGSAPARSRGLLGSMVQIGYPIGNLAAIGMFALLSRVSESDFWSGAGGFRS